MPELPEVESIRLALAPIVGARIARAELRRADIVENLPARGRAAALLEGDAVRALHRHGKQMAIEGERGGVVCIQLGMSGQLLLDDGPRPPAPHEHLVWRLGDGRRLAFRDPRRFGGLSLYEGLESLRTRRWSRLGPDALSDATESLTASCGRTKRAIKAVLLDQVILAGVGNIYADEALFAARIRPTRRARTLSAAEIGELSRAVRSILVRAIRAGGSTLRDYVRPDGGAGSGAALHQVYGKHGQPCPRCGAPLRRTAVGQRTGSYCPGCQR